MSANKKQRAIRVRLIKDIFVAADEYAPDHYIGEKGQEGLLITDENLVYWDALALMDLHSQQLYLKHEEYVCLIPGQKEECSSTG